MMEFYTHSGERIRPERIIGKGGEGEVYAIAGSPDRLLKRYTLSDLASREAKISHMIAKELFKTTNLIAYPIAPVKDARGRFAGFTMARVNEHQPLHELYSPGARKAAFPTANYKFLVHAAANIARVVASAHNAGCVIGDINHSGVLISKGATAALIDADSFQVTDGAVIHFCKVGVPEYTPPELQQQSLDGIVRTQTHDEFGLAVAIFLLLWMGRHPFSGRYSSGDMPMDKAIKEFRFAYTTQRSVGMSPPPGVPMLKDFPPAIAAAFEQAFGPKGPSGRPSAVQWVNLLRELEDNLRDCSANKLHHYPASAAECPWCRMEKTLRAHLFLPPFGTGQTHTPIIVELVGRDLEGIWRVIESIPAPTSTPADPPLPTLQWTPNADVLLAQSKAELWKYGGAAIMAGALFALIVAPSLFLLWLGAAWYGYQKFQGPAGSGPSHNIVKQYENVETQFQRALIDWRQRSSGSAFAELKQSLREIKTQIERLPNAEHQLTKSYFDNRRIAQLDLFLDAFLIRRVKISGVGPSKLANLTSYGIETAADIVLDKVLKVPGFGPVNSQPLLNWRREIEAKFVYNASPTPADVAAINRIKTDLSDRSAALHKQLADGAKKLAQVSADIRNKQQQPDTVLLRLHTQRSQLLGDLKSLNIAPPIVHVPQPTVRYTYSPAPTSTTGTSCPSCGGGMVLRMARRGRRPGRQFWGCSRYPMCKGTRPYP